MLWLKNKTDTSFSDGALISRYKLSGEMQYAGELYQRYTHLVLGVCLKYLRNEEDSKDAVMDIFEHVCRVLLEHEVTNFKSWLHSVARNHCLMKLRRDKATGLTTAYADNFEETLVENPEIEHQWDEQARENQFENLRSALNQLNPAQRTCIDFFYLKSMSYKEVAHATGYSVKQVKSHIQNGKRNLKILLPPRDEDIDESQY